MFERKRKEEWESRRDGDRHAWFKLIPSLQFQQDLATSFLDFLLRSSQWGSEAEINGKRTVSFSVPHTHSHSSWHQFAFDWENAAVEHKLVTISKRALCVSLIGVSVSALWFQYIWTAPSGLGLQTGVRLWTRERVRHILGWCLKDDGGGRVPTLLSFSDPAWVEREDLKGYSNKYKVKAPLCMQMPSACTVHWCNSH